MLDIQAVRSHFPAFDNGATPRFFENAGGSFACRQTVDALTNFYTSTKVQPYAAYAESRLGGDLMDRSYTRWAQALGVAADNLTFGPSTSANTYMLSTAFREVLAPGDEVIVTNQDHEANTGAIRRAANAAGATVREWGVNIDSGLLDVGVFEVLLNENTRLVTFPHCSNIIGAENDVARICALARAAGAFTIVDGVSMAPHGLPDLGSLGCDAYLFSLYKVYSVHQGLLYLSPELAAALPAQGHGFNANYPNKRFAPAGPDHAQIAAAGGVLDYVEALDGTVDDVFGAARRVSEAWQTHERNLIRPVLDLLREHPAARLIGPDHADTDLHRAPTVAFVPAGQSSASCAQRLVDAGIMTGSGDFYAGRVLDALGVAPDDGVVRVSWVHYTSADDIAALVDALDQALTLT